MSDQTITKNIAKLLERVRLAAEKSQRDKSEVLVLAVSKTRPAGALREAFHCGMCQFGENYLNEALEKMEQLKDLPLIWHFIGPIQSNKTRSIAQSFDWVHSVDRSKIARRLSEQRPAAMAPLQVCIQVNISCEPGKSGVSLTELPVLAQEIMQLPGIDLRGLMAIPAATDDPQEQSNAFAQLRLARDNLERVAPGLETLSMGMSGDMEAAIHNGSTIVRIGTDIFGPRNT
jgi:pyridoxal phosphate enzyme (YggS family)